LIIVWGKGNEEEKIQEVKGAIKLERGMAEN
jgi:hypothetical protein